jgi:hypothetical protein
MGDLAYSVARSASEHGDKISKEISLIRRALEDHGILEPVVPSAMPIAYTPEHGSTLRSVLQAAMADYRERMSRYEAAKARWWS